MAIRPKEVVNNPATERYTKYFRIAQARGYTQVQSDTIARMMIATDQGQNPTTALSSFSTADKALYSQFRSI